MSAPSYLNGVTDQTLLGVIQDSLLEVNNGGASMTTQQFQLAAVIDALNQAQMDFLREAGIVVNHLGYEGDSNSGLGTTPQVETVPLPQDCMDLRRAAWIALDAGGAVNYVQELPPQDSWASDAVNRNWESSVAGQPPLLEDEHLPAIPGIYLNSPSQDIGQLDCLYVPVANALSNTGLPLSVPPDFAPALVWRALEIILDSQGEGSDPQRAKLCRDQYQLYVALARSLVMTPSLIPV